MALINCPECGRQVSSQAEKCPGCGFPIRNYAEKFPKQPKEKREKHTEPRASFVFSLIALFFVGSGSILVTIPIVIAFVIGVMGLTERGADGFAITGVVVSVLDALLLIGVILL